MSDKKSPFVSCLDAALRGVFHGKQKKAPGPQLVPGYVIPDAAMIRGDGGRPSSDLLIDGDGGSAGVLPGDDR